MNQYYYLALITRVINPSYIEYIENNDLKLVKHNQFTINCVTSETAIFDGHYKI